VGAGVQFILIFMLIIPPLGRWVNAGFLAVDSVVVRQALSGILLAWMLISPIVGTIFYRRLPLEQKAGREGYLLLFWWITVVVSLLGAFSLGTAG
jgi:hypothetical protein